MWVWVVVLSVGFGVVILAFGGGLWLRGCGCCGVVIFGVNRDGKQRKWFCGDASHVCVAGCGASWLWCGGGFANGVGGRVVFFV